MKAPFTAIIKMVMGEDSSSTPNIVTDPSTQYLPSHTVLGRVSSQPMHSPPIHTVLERATCQARDIRMERQGSRERIKRQRSNTEISSSHPPLERQIGQDNQQPRTKPLEIRVDTQLLKTKPPLERQGGQDNYQTIAKPLETRLQMPDSFSHRPASPSLSAPHQILQKSNSQPQLEKGKQQKQSLTRAAPHNHQMLTKSSSHPYTISLNHNITPTKNTKKLRMRSFLWVKPGSSQSSSSVFSQLLPVLAVNLGALSSGLALGYSAVLLPQLLPDADNSTRLDDDVNKSSTRYQPFTANMEQGSWIASIFGLGAVVGGLIAAYLGNKFGRRVALLCFAIPDLLSWVLVASSQNLPMMLVGRFLAGVAAAGYSPNIQIFVAEISQPVHRGWLSGITVPTLSTGTLIMYVLGSLLPWHLAAAACVPIPILMVLSLLIIWDSPYWYLHSGQDKKAHKAMEMFRSSDDHVVSEIFQIHEHIKQETKSFSFTEGLGKIFTDKRYLRPFIILNSLFLLMLFSGKFAIEFYAVQIFQHAGGHMNEYHSAIVMAVIYLIGSLLFIPAVKRFSRKLLLVSSSFTMAISLAVLGVAMYSHDGDHHGMEYIGTMSWLPLTCVIIYMLAAPLGLGSIPFIYISEFFPSEMRSVLGSLTIAISNLELFVVVKTFPTMSSSMGEHGVYWLYASVCIATVLFVLSYVPETKDKTFAEVENKFTKIYKHYERASPWVTPLPSPATSIRKMQLRQLQFTQ